MRYGPTKSEDHIPWIALIEQNLAARLQEIVDTIQQPGRVAFVEHIVSHNEIKLSVPQLARDCRQDQELDVTGQVGGSRRVQIESHCGDETFMSRRINELARKYSIAASEFQNCTRR